MLVADCGRPAQMSQSEDVGGVGPDIVSECVSIVVRVFKMVCRIGRCRFELFRFDLEV